MIYRVNHTKVFAVSHTATLSAQLLHHGWNFFRLENGFEKT